MKLIFNLPIIDEHKRILNRRMNKLKRDPKGFLGDSYKKRSNQARKFLPIKYSSSNHFTVVSAVYNVEDYIEGYFDSLINQSLSFKKYIKLILIDDGSTDSSADIIKKWQAKFPNNIRYMYKKNGGQASARNLGMQYVDTEWVTFIDPDDFIDVDYFYTLNSILENDDSLSMIVANIQLFMEEYNDIRNRHPLRFRFKNTESKFPAIDLKNYINLSAAASIFKTSIIQEKAIIFGEDVKPTFEDGKFIAEYLLRNDGNVLFSKNLTYLYRKRNDKSSTVDKSWEDKRKYRDILEKGYLAILVIYSNELGYVPNHIQRTILYDITWYLRLLIDNPEKTLFLSCEEKNIFHKLIEDIFYYIDSEVILDFDLAGIWFAFKVGMIETFKKEKVDNQIVYIENIDREKEQILVSCFIGHQRAVSFQFDGKDVIPIYQKVVKHDFVGQNFVNEFRSWVSYSSKEKFEVFIDGNKSRISLKGKQYKNGVKLEEIIGKFSPSLQYKTDGSWLLMDRDTQADDNAESFYRYLMINHPHQKICFALRRSSPDWSRLENAGFNLVDFGTKEFEKNLKLSSKIISSHLDKYINNYFGDEYEYSKKFVFLQHGVIKDDLSDWFSSKNNLQCLITTTTDEYSSIVDKDSRYKLTEKEVVLTGIPRHDNLLADNSNSRKVILIMPTWRKGIMGDVMGVGNTRTINSDFMSTSYAKYWSDFLNSNELKELSCNYGYEVIFAPHANIEPYLPNFKLPEYISIWTATNSEFSMQKLFQEASLMITDYSSVAFEMGLLNKYVLYYQFDQEEFFTVSHLFKKGYFSYVENGFGPVATTQKEILDNLGAVLKNEGEPLEPYKTRMLNTFPFRDGKNCERVYEAILDLDRPDTAEISVDKILDYTQQAITHEAWDLALERIDNALQHSAITPVQVEEITRIKESVLQTGYQDEPVKLANILWHEKRLQEALDALKQIDDTEASDELLRLRVRLAILNNDFMLARDSQKLLLENYNETCTIEDWQFYTQLAHV